MRNVNQRTFINDDPSKICTEKKNIHIKKSIKKIYIV